LTLDTLARWSLRDRLLACQLTGADSDALRVRATTEGVLPRGRYGDELWSKTLEELPAIDEPQLVALTENIQLTVGERVLIATLPPGFYRTATSGFVYCSASSRRGSNQLAVKLGLLFLSLAENATQIETWFSKESKPKVLTALPREHAETRLLELCRLHELAQCIPLPFWSNAYDKMRTTEARAKKNALSLDRDQLLMTAWAEWNDGNSYYGSGLPERCLPATRACFRGLSDPFVWTPELNVDWLPEPDAPLAYRLFSFVSAWENAVGDAQ
jgi:exonuclease V gamma subunit